MSVAEFVRERIAAAPEGSFLTSRDLVVDTDARAGVDIALHRAAASGDVLRMTRGLYWKGRRTRFGMSRPDDLAVALETAKAHGWDTGVGPTGHTAASYLGLSTQVPAKIEVAVPAHITALDGVRFHTRTGTARVGLNPVEVALLEVLRDFPRYAEASWTDLVARVETLVKSDSVNLKRVVVAAKHERRPKARELADRLLSAVAGS